MNSQPDHGFVSPDTEISYKFGLDKEKCLHKINQADDEYAQSIIELEERLNNSAPNILSSSNIRRDNYNNYNSHNVIQNENEILNLEGILDRLRLSKYTILHNIF